jgi:hypothetical protein
VAAGVFIGLVFGLSCQCLPRYLGTSLPRSLKKYYVYINIPRSAVSLGRGHTYGVLANVKLVRHVIVKPVSASPRLAKGPVAHGLAHTLSTLNRTHLRLHGNFQLDTNGKLPLPRNLDRGPADKVEGSPWDQLRQHRAD